MKLMGIDDYLKTRFTLTSRPGRKTVIRRINDGVLPGKQIGRLYYVDVDAERQFTGNRLVDQVLAASY